MIMMIMFIFGSKLESADIGTLGVIYLDKTLLTAYDVTSFLYTFRNMPTQ
jgi:hypothetical protein